MARTEIWKTQIANFDLADTTGVLVQNNLSEQIIVKHEPEDGKTPRDETGN